MIRYSLRCGNEHEFDGWFASSGEFDRQKKLDLLRCPHCGDGDIEKALMAPAVPARSRETAVEEPGKAVAPVPSGQRMTGIDENTRKMLAKIRKLQEHVLANTEDVGQRFSEEARKIHYGEVEARGIRGQADLEEAASLIEEGIEILPVPQLPEDKN